MRLAMTGEKLPAVTAAEWGLVAERVAAEEFPARGGEAVAAALAQGRHHWHWADTKAAVNAASVDVEGALAREEVGKISLSHTHGRRPGRRGLPRQAPRRLHRPLSVGLTGALTPTPGRATDRRRFDGGCTRRHTPTGLRVWGTM